MKWLGPLFDRYEVDFVLSGHDHNYERTYPVRGDAPHDIWQGPTYILPRGAVEVVSGGGGAPLYQGGKGDDGPDVAQYVPSDCFIDRRAFADYAELRDFLLAIGPAGVARYREAARDFLGSDRFHPFSKEAFAELFVSSVEEDVGVELH